MEDAELTLMEFAVETIAHTIDPLVTVGIGVMAALVALLNTVSNKQLMRKIDDLIAAVLREKGGH
jgi:cytochrome bd-type quinol oxidase subunit 1